MRIIIFQYKIAANERVPCSNCGYESDLIYEVLIDYVKGKNLYSEAMTPGLTLLLCPDCCTLFNTHTKEIITKEQLEGK